ncbi:MAG: hypothetical protein Q7J60_02690 [Bradyrhizobium sp.]|nr:hypothetical protein [Bradyrhizobium sp.]
MDEHPNKCQTDLHPGGLILLAIRTISSDFRGSVAILVSMLAHLEQAKVRFSVSPRRSSMLVRPMRIPHRTQRGRSIGDSRTSVREFMAHRCSGNRVEKISQPPSNVYPETDSTDGNIFPPEWNRIGAG